MAGKKGAARYKRTKERIAKVTYWAIIGMNLTEIAIELGVCPETVQKYHGEDIKAAKARGKATKLGQTYSSKHRLDRIWMLENVYKMSNRKAFNVEGEVSGGGQMQVSVLITDRDGNLQELDFGESPDTLSSSPEAVSSS